MRIVARAAERAVRGDERAAATARGSKRDDALVVFARRRVRGKRARARGRNHRRNAGMRIAAATGRGMRIDATLVVRELPLPRQHEPRPRDLLIHRAQRARRAAAAGVQYRSIFQPARRVFRLLVPPVRGEAVLRGVVHLPRADLNLKRASRRVADHRVQAPVPVLLRRSDVILRLALHRGPPLSRVHRRERGVARRLAAVDDDPQRADVVDVVDRPQPLRAHLAKRRVERFRAAADVRRVVDAGGAQRRRDVAHRARDRLSLLAVAELERQRRVLGGVKQREARVLEARLERPYPEPRRERDEDVERLVRQPRRAVAFAAERVDAAAVGRGGQRRQRREPVREFHDDDPRVRGRDEHRAELHALLRVELARRRATHPRHEREPRSALHHVDNRGAARERYRELFRDDRRAVEDVAEQRGRDRAGVHPEVGDDGRALDAALQKRRFRTVDVVDVAAVRPRGDSKRAHDAGETERGVSRLRVAEYGRLDVV